MIKLQDLNLAFGQRHLFDQFSLMINADQKIGLVGRNGSGKSTLFKIIAGVQGYDSGSVELEKGRTIAYLSQEVTLLSEKTVLDETFSVFAHLTELERERDELDAYFHDPATDKNDHEKLERYAHVQHALMDSDKNALLVRTKMMLAGLGFDDAWLQKPVSQLSVGWKMRVVLAKLLLMNADFYLFDEPTNHLDMVSKEWFLGFLKQASFGFLLVSHDRYFLDHACKKIVALARGNGKLYHGNYTAYLVQKEQDDLALEKAFLQQQREIKVKQANIDRFKASASRASQAQSWIKQLEKIELITIEKKPAPITLHFDSMVRPGKMIMKADRLAFSFGDTPIFSNASCEIERDQKIALIAANGKGKTTFLNVVMGKYPCQQGTVTVGHNVSVAFFEQEQERALDSNKTIYDEVESVCTTSEMRQRIRTILGAFLFPGDDVNKKIGVLSGGERNRVAMAKVLLTNANFLILDEPTNHLDLESKEILLKALKDYTGTILFVSHDRTFLDELATHIFELTPKGINRYEGNYSAYLYYKSVQQDGCSLSFPPQQASIAVKKEKQTGGKQQYEQRKKIQSLESKIEKLEAELNRLNDGYAALVFGSDAFIKHEEYIVQVKQQLHAAYLEWESLHG